MPELEMRGPLRPSSNNQSSTATPCVSLDQMSPVELMEIDAAFVASETLLVVMHGEIEIGAA